MEIKTTVTVDHSIVLNEDGVMFNAWGTGNTWTLRFIHRNMGHYNTIYFGSIAECKKALSTALEFIEDLEAHKNG